MKNDSAERARRARESRTRPEKKYNPTAARRSIQHHDQMKLRGPRLKFRRAAHAWFKKRRTAR